MPIFHKRRLSTYLSHHLFYGLGFRLKEPPPTIIGGLGRAYGIDVSHWEESFDPDEAVPNLIDFAIFKATEGTTWIDPSFAGFYSAAVGKVPILGAYHYLRSGYTGRSQADNFSSMLAGKDFDILVCDFESTNNQMDDDFVEMAQEFGQFVKTWYPNCKLLFYTNPSTYDSIVYPGSLRLFGEDVFTKSPWDGFWVAQYYYDPSPDKDPSMPQSRSDWVLWQYSEAGDPDLHGTGGWCDQNVFNGVPADLHAWLGNDSPPSPVGDQIDYPFDGVKRTKGIRFGCSFQALEISPESIKSAKFVYPGVCETIENIPGDIVSNVTGFSFYDCKPNQLLKIDGITIHDQAGTEPYFYWNTAKELYFDYKPEPLSSLENTSAIKRYLIIDWEVNPNPSPAWDEIHPWQLLGTGPNGETVLITVQTPGFNLYRAADLLLEFGVYAGGDLDSGGSGQTKVAGEITRCTSEVRAVSNFFSLMIGETSSPNGGNMYEVKIATTLHRWRDNNAKGDYGTLNQGTVLDSSAISGNWLILYFDPLGDDNNPPYAVDMNDLKVPPPPSDGEAYTLTVTVEKPGYNPNTHTITGTLDPQ